MRPNDKKIKEVYNKIAEGFYNLRQQPITHELEKLTEKWKPGLLLDIGCGIGNSTLPFAKKGFQCIGTDIAQKQIKSAKKYFENTKLRHTFLFLKCKTFHLSLESLIMLSLRLLSITWIQRKKG